MNLTEVQDRTYELLCLIDDICRGEGVRYFLDGGSEIGSVREKDLIAWDDDIDIKMQWAEYPKFRAAMRKHLPPYIRLVEPADFAPLFYDFVTRVVDTRYTLRKVTEKGERILVTTLTKRMAESLTEYLKDLDIRVRYLHSDIQTMERMELLRDLRLGEYDVLVGINLLREGLDLPEVALVAILDADKEGFLRSETSLVQTIGRAARNVDGRVILYGNQLTESMAKAVSETNRRRALQEEYNRLNGITPETVRNAIRSVLEITRRVEETAETALTEDERAALMRQIEEEMISAAKDLEFERAAKLRDRLLELRGEAPMKDDNQSRRHRRRERTRKSEH